MPQPILILSGPVGSGKTVVARKLVQLLPAPVAYIEGDVFWSFLGKRPGRGPTPETFRTIMSSMTAAAVPFAMADSRVILDFSIPPWFLPTVRKIAGVRQVPVDYVVLCPSEEVCSARAATRAEGRIDDYSPYRELYRSFGEATNHLLADDTATADELARQIALGLGTGRFRLG